MLPGGELDQLVRMFCPECVDERPFERPECLDGHGADCPERACVDCGAAVMVGPLSQPETDEASWAAELSVERGGQRVIRPALADLALPLQAAPAETGQTEPAAAQSAAAQSVAAQPETRPMARAGRTPRSVA